jgi:hypothetical protein
MANGQQSTNRINQSRNLTKRASFIKILTPFRKMSSFFVDVARLDGMM